MNARHCIAAVAVAALGAHSLQAPRAYAGDDVLDTRITFVLADDNVLSGLPVSVGTRPTTFFDNYDTRDSGDETLTHVVLYKQFVGPKQRVFSEAGLVARFALAPELGLDDDGSFIQVAYQLLPERESLVYLLTYPINADRFRLGYSYDISWAGNAGFGRQLGSRTPGFKLGWMTNRFEVFAGLKTSFDDTGDPAESRQLYGTLAGVSVRLTESLRWEVGAGHLQEGVLPFVNVATDYRLVVARGVSTQLAYERGLPIERSVDLRPYRSDPRLPWSPFEPQSFDSSWSYRLASEWSWIERDLRAFENPSIVRREVATAGDVGAAVRYGHSTATLDVVYRNLSFLHYQHSVVAPFQSLPRAPSQADIYVAGGAEHRFGGLRLTPGIVGGIQRPAAFTLEPPAGTERYVVRSDGALQRLADDARPVPIPSARTFVRWDATDGVVMIAEATFTLDNNLARASVTPSGETEYVDAPASQRRQVALALVVMARF